MLYVATNLLTLDPAAAGIPPEAMPPSGVLMVAIPAHRSDSGKTEERPFYRLTPTLYAWIMCRLKELESRAYGLDGKNEDDLGVMPSADAEWLLNGQAAERLTAIMEYANERWAQEGFSRWRQLLDAKGRPPALPRARR